MRHATDADHVIAVATIASAATPYPEKAALIGAAVWGLGHTLTILVVGGGIILFGPGHSGLGSWLSMEFSVGLMLIILDSSRI
mgnify:CR=1 FL=1